MPKVKKTTVDASQQTPLGNVTILQNAAAAIANGAAVVPKGFPASVAVTGTFVGAVWRHRDGYDPYRGADHIASAVGESPRQRVDKRRDRSRLPRLGKLGLKGQQRNTALRG
jgi:hypothetical protein